MKLNEFLSLNEIKQDIYPPKSDLKGEPKSTSTSTVRGGLKGRSGNFNIRVDTIGKGSDKEDEVDMERFQKIMSHISGLAAFGRNIDNPAKVGGNEINQFVISELAKSFLIGTINKKDIQIVLKALEIRRPETLRFVKRKMRNLVSKTNDLITDPEILSEVSNVEKKALKNHFRLYINKQSDKWEISKLANYIKKLQGMPGYKTVLALISNEERYSKFFS